VIFSHLHRTTAEERVRQAFVAWDSLRHSVDELERGMRSALVRFADGSASRPDQLFSDVLARRRDCESALRALMDAIAATRASEPVPLPLAASRPRTPRPTPKPAKPARSWQLRR
jgi:hypothetical protein